ncbi:MAG: GNAT family N-acetyltransferase [Sphingosinicella sp.]|uniref:GNAT family N-acetyltransferase n=1 Tax=Sphingosinicella sp. TaxID=1917971 RepID=UPI0040381F7A
MPIEFATAVLASVEQGFPATIDAIAVAARHAFLRRPWYADGGNQGARTLIATRPGGEAIGALPLVRVGPAILGIKAIAGPYWPFRFMPLAANANEEELTAALDTPVARRTLGRLWRLGPAREGDAAVLIRAARRAGYRALSRRAGTSYALDIAGGDWPKPSTLRNLRKHEKKLARLGSLDFRFVSGAAWSGAVLDELAEIERKAWAGNQKDADRKFLDPTLLAGWAATIADPVLAEMLSVGILSIGGASVAFSFGLDCGRTRHCIATSYDARFARHSPGYLTGYWTYMKAAERGVEMLSLGAGDNGEKSSMGAVPEGELTDYLFVRGAMLAGLLRPFWR